MYITIEGPIGVGKSSLTKLLSQHLDYQTLFEIVEENPFLERFYEDQDKYAFQTEMFFLTNRYTQLRHIDQDFLQQGKSIVSDYDLHKNIIFARQTLKGVDLALFETLFKEVNTTLPTSNLTIFLTASVETLQSRIAMRGRKFEEHIEDSYLSSLISAYNEYIIEEQKVRPDNILVFDGDKFDFVHNQEDRNEVLKMVDLAIDQIKE